jgi:integrase/recombinase XerD
MLSSRDSKIVNQWLERWPSPHTRSCYRRDTNRLFANVRKPMDRIGLGDLQSFAQSLIEFGLAPISRARTIAAVKSLFSFCYRVRYLLANPAMELVLPTYERRLAERIVSEEDVSRLLASDTSARNSALLRLLYIAGLRVSEACGLRWRNLQPRGSAGGITVFGKNGRTRSIALPTVLWHELLALRGGAGAEDLVFPSHGGKRLDRGRVRVILRRAAQPAGVSTLVSPHWLRHAHASHALDRGAPIHLVQATLGHSSVATTSAYLHARPGDSSARFLAPDKSSDSGRISLPFARSRAMNVTTANQERPKEKSTVATFTIDTDNNIAAHAEAPDKTGNQQVFTSEEELAKLAVEWPVSRLIEVWNSFAGVAPFDHLKLVKKFTSRKAAVSRIWQAIARLSPEVAPQAERVAPAKGGSKTAPTKVTRRARAQKGSSESRSNKKAEVIALMKRAKGVTLAEIMETTGWQKHTIRGFVSILGSKGGEKVESAKNADGERTYRIAKLL